MPEFAELHKATQQLGQEVKDHILSSSACSRFFLKFTFDDKTVIADARFISTVAHLIIQHENVLCSSFQRSKKDIGIRSIDEFIEYKKRILIGCYILKWYQYRNSVLPNSRYLMDCFRQILGVETVNELGEEVNNSLDCFSDFCSIIGDKALKNEEGGVIYLDRKIQESIQETRHYYNSCGINQVYMTVEGMIGSLMSK